jgi:hypothetical protein
MKNRKSKTIKKTATALVVTVEKFQKDSLTDYQTQGDCKPYTKCRTSSIPRRLVECLSGYKDIKKSIGDLKRVLKNWNISDVHSFVFIISNIIGAEATLERKQRAKNVDEISYYLNLPQYSFRLGLHNLKAKNYQGNRQKKSNYGVTFKEPNLPNTFEAKDGVNVVEYVYVYWTPELLRKVAQAILHLLETGQWDESIAPADAKNISPMKKNEKVGNLQGIKTGASRGKTKKTKYLCDTCQWYVGCTWCKDGKKSVCDGYKPYNTDYEYPSFDGICGAKKTATALIYKVPLKVKDVYKSGEKMNISLARNMAIGLDLSENELMQLCELGLVIEAKRIAHLNEPLKFRFEKMVDLYGRQLTIQPKDSRSATLQQYSTPCPLAFLLGEYVKKGTEEREDDNLKFFEPTAGNGLLTISFRAYQMVVNELDDIRFNNLKRLGFFRTTNEDATCSSEPLKCFSGIIANPPFAPLEKKDFLVRKGVVDGREATYEFDRLDHKIAIMALDHMKDDGRAAIIIGGKMAVKLKDYKESYWKNGVLFGGFRNFITYLNRQYNIEDILYINGDLYRKQGTTFPIVAILINGRTKWNGDKRHQWHPFDESKDGQIDTFNELYHRMSIHLFGEVSVPSALKAKALMLKMKMAKSKGLDGIDEDKCIKQIAVLHKAADSINNWIEKNKSGRFFIKLPRKVEKEISKIIGRSVDVHKIDSNGIRHSLKNHGEKGRKLQINDIPIKKEYYMLIPYIMVSPDYIEKGANDFGRESIRFVKNLSNGTLIVVEKESLNDKDVFETVNMWGTLSDVVNAKSPNIHVRNVAISTSDVANIIKDAELAIIKDEKK